METPNYASQPKNMRLTPRGATNSPMSRVFPRILGGQCEKHGTLDPNYKGDEQYKLCECYKGMEAKCVYCPPSADQDEVVKKSNLMSMEHPYRPGELVMWCQQYDCVRAHEKAFPR